jgi:hypothetical protein
MKIPPENIAPQDETHTATSDEESGPMDPNQMTPADMLALKSMIMPPSNVPTTEDITCAVAGLGQVGSALWRLFDRTCRVIPVDPDRGYNLSSNVDVVDHLHIAFPFGKEFIPDVMYWIKILDPICLIIHSTVKPGTTRELAHKCLEDTSTRVGSNIVHSSVMGKHPFLSEHVGLFVKVIGGLNEEAMKLSSTFLKKAGLVVIGFDSPEHSEWATLMLKLREAMEWTFAEQMYTWCKENDINMNQIYGAYTQAWNRGHTEIGDMDSLYPILEPDLRTPDPEVKICMDILHDIIPPGDILRRTVLDNK